MSDTLGYALARLPAAGQRFNDLDALIWEAGLARDLLIRVRNRIAQLVGDSEVTDPEPGSPIDPATEAAIRFTEQYVIDAHGMTDADCARLVEAFGEPGATALTVAVAVFEASSRSRVALGSLA